MPKPGPRPYECIRRAWHSDTHQALRAGLIHEIFRIVHELHSTSTRRKKEWQEKLPIVVLRAEEILYSKANSESEYLNIDTLKTRLEDAVNTIIRREDIDESGPGPYLPPCVEAALSLGCVPKKTPRGQRQGFSRLPVKRSNSSNVTPLVRTHASSSAFCPVAMATEDQAQAPNLHIPFATTPLPVGVCYTSETNPRPNIFPTSHELSTTLLAPSFPELGFVDFLRTPDVNRLTSFPPVLGTAGPFSQMLSNFDPETTTGLGLEPIRNSRANLELGGLFRTNPNGATSTSSTVSSPVSTLSNMSQVLSAESFTESALQPAPVVGSASVAGLDAPRCKLSEKFVHVPADTQLRFQQRMSTIPLGNDHPSRVSEWGSSPSSWPNVPGARIDEMECTLAKPSVHHNTPPAAFAADNLKRNSLEVHDLQLRLGPPGDDPALPHASPALEQELSRSWQHSREGASKATSSWNSFKMNPYSGWNLNTPAQVQICRKLDANGYDQIRNIAVCDSPTSERLRGNPVAVDSFSSTCENMVHLGSSLPPLQFKWCKR